MTSLNILVCPLAPADVVISFDASENSSFCVVGTLSGRVYAYKTNHVLDLLAITQPLPQLNHIHANISNISQPLSPHVSIPYKPDSDSFQSNGFEFLPTCKTISVVGSVPSPSIPPNTQARSSYNNSHLEQLPQFKPITQQFPLRLDCRQDFLFHQDLLYINDLQHYYLQTQHHQSHQPQSSSSTSTSKSTSQQSTSIQPQPDSSSYHGSTSSFPRPPTRLVYTQPDEFVCRKMVDSTANAEPVKGLHIVSRLPSNFQGAISEGSIVMALGDTMLKIAPTIKAPSFLNMKYQRQHDAKLCQSTYCLAHNTAAILVTPGDEDTKPLLLDASTQRQSFLNPIPLDHLSTPLYLYNSNTHNPLISTDSNQSQFSIAWREYYPKFQTTILLSCLLSTCKVTDSLYFSDTKRPIGFQQSGSRIVSIVEANHIQVNNLMNILFTTSLEDFYQIQENKAKLQNTETQPEEDEEDAEPQNEVIIPSEEEQLGLLIDDQTVMDSIVAKLDQRVRVRDREYSDLTEKIQALADEQFSSFSHSPNPSTTQSTSNSETSSPLLYFSTSFRQSVFQLLQSNPLLFSPRTDVLDKLSDPAFWKSFQEKHHTHNLVPLSEPVEMDLVKELYTHAYLDWLQDQPIGTNPSSIIPPSTTTTNNKSTNNKSNGNRTSPSIPSSPKSKSSPKNKSSTTTSAESQQPEQSSTDPKTQKQKENESFPTHFSLQTFGKSFHPSKWSPVGHALPNHIFKPSGSHPTVYAELLQHSKTFRCVKFKAHKHGHIVGIWAEFDGALITTIGTDFKLKLWYKGELICKFVNIKGDILSTSVVLVKRVGRCIYYTCCDGVYCVILPFDPVVDVIGANLDSIHTTLTALPLTIEQKLSAQENNRANRSSTPGELPRGEHKIDEEEGGEDEFYQQLPTPSQSAPNDTELLNSISIPHNDVVARDFAPRFYTRPLHQCDQRCCLKFVPNTPQPNVS